MKILAIMQNMWVRDPARINSMFSRLQAEGRSVDEITKNRRRVIAWCLFAGCKSGRVLRKVFGPLCDSIVWEEANPTIGGHAASVFPPDADHLRACIAGVKPDIIITFGEVAKKGIAMVSTTVPVIFAPHPAARYATVLDELRAAHKLLALSK